jgi:hypothetical protein
MFQHSEGVLCFGYIPQSMAALQEAYADTHGEGLAGTSKLVVLPRSSSIGLAKGHNRRGFSTGSLVHKGLLLKVVPLHGS